MNVGKRFRDRRDAGRRLTEALAGLWDRDFVVIALPRGGVPVAWEMAEALAAPLDVVLVRKIAHPLAPEMALGAIVDGADPVIVRNEAAIRGLGVDDAFIEREAERMARVIDERRALYRSHRVLGQDGVRGRHVVLVDDGLATGATMLAAIEAMRRRGAASVTAAIPVAAPDALDRVRIRADEVVCLMAPADFEAVGQFYTNFDPVADAEVVAFLDAAAARAPGDCDRSNTSRVSSA